MKAFPGFLLLLLIAAPAFGQVLWTEGEAGLEIDRSVADGLLAKSTAGCEVFVDGERLAVDVVGVSVSGLGAVSVRGRFAKGPDTFFLFCQGEQGAAAALMLTPDGTTWKLDATSGRLALRPVDALELGGCGGGISPADLPAVSLDRYPPTPPRPSAPAKALGDAADDGSRHDVLIAYTPAAEIFMGGYDQIQAEAQLAVDAANLTYDNSLITSDLRLVHVMSTPYDENTAWSYIDHLNALYLPDDGKMDEVLVTRNLVGADFVSLLIDGREALGDVPTCGIAPVMQSDQIEPWFEIQAISVVSVQCATDRWSFAHEVGHNRGCAHNRENTQIDGAYSYSYGRRFMGANDVGYCSVMAYEDAEGVYSRVPYFTNPDVNHAGVPTGIEPTLAGEAHNTLTHENTAALCAGFRAERTFVQFGWTHFADGMLLTPFPTITEAVASARPGGHIVLNNGSASFTGTLADARVYVAAGSGGAVLGGD